MPSAAVVGAGAWGTALAVQLARCGHEVRLWTRDPERAAEIGRIRRNEGYLPGIRLPGEIGVTADLPEAVAGTRRVLLAVPSRSLGEAAGTLSGVIEPEARLVCASKGLEAESGRLLHEVLEEALGGRIGKVAILSGPSFAQEVAEGLPTALTVAAESLDRAEEVADWLRCDPLRVYSSDDRIGVELGGAVKNVVAIAAGIADGLGLGYNARAALITRGLAEIMRLGAAYGGDPETFAGLAGLGDLVLTCTGPLSRNHQLGERLGSGVPVAEVPTDLWQRAEGVGTADALFRRAAELGVDMPITEQVFRVLFEGEDPERALDSLMRRAPKPEQGPGSGRE